MARLVQADRKPTVTEITMCFNSDMQKSISEHTTHWKWALKGMGNSSRRPITPELCLNKYLMKWSLNLCAVLVRLRVDTHPIGPGQRSIVKGCGEEVEILLNSILLKYAQTKDPSPPPCRGIDGFSDISQTQEPSWLQPGCVCVFVGVRESESLGWTCWLFGSDCVWGLCLVTIAVSL